MRRSGCWCSAAPTRFGPDHCRELGVTGPRGGIPEAAGSQSRDLVVSSDRGDPSVQARVAAWRDSVARNARILSWGSGLEKRYPW